MDIKNEVLYRVYFLLFGILVPLSVLLMYKTVKISIVEGERWRNESIDTYVKEKELEAERGSILADDYSFMATSVPFFDLYFDPQVSSDKDFLKYKDTLAHCLATHVDESYTVGGFSTYLDELRATDRKHVLLKKKVSYAEKKFIENFPLFNLGRYKGGLIAEKRSERKRPFGLMARRTIGYVRDHAKPVGLEGYFDEVLGGKPGKQFMIRVDNRNDLWMPAQDLTTIEPVRGDDIVTTIDVNIQDITEEALLKAMNHHNADWGTAIVMEVETGKIKAISNLGKTDDGWWETYNHAIGTRVEPGSTFKLATIMSLLEDGYVNLDDTIPIFRGQAEFYEETMVDASPSSFKIDSTSIRSAFEMSSNVGMATLANNFYGKLDEDAMVDEEDIKRASKFINNLKQFNLHLKTGIEIDGEKSPLIKRPFNKDDQWSGTTIPWMSIGYEALYTPLQQLTFFNAVANDGQMVRPFLVTEIQRFGETIESFKPIVLKKPIASEETIKQVRSLLEGVVERGTAHKIKTDKIKLAGKTGTAQIKYTRHSRGTRVGGYQASFVGYFPADKPKYSCIVMLNHPRQNGIYGGDVAAPVFRDIAIKCYYSDIDIYPAYNHSLKPQLAAKKSPHMDIGEKEDIKKVLAYLEIPFYGTPSTQMTVLDGKTDSLRMERKTITEDKVPNVVGMGLRDALYVLENKGLKVKVVGAGKVKLQSIIPGTLIRGQTIKITLG